jgi:hypothetical protein
MESNASCTGAWQSITFGAPVNNPRNSMNASLRFSRIPLAFATAFLIGNVNGQGNCTNQSQFGGAVADPGGLVTTISTCSFESEYSVISQVIPGAGYQFTLSSGGYITVHQDTYNGPIIGQGYSPVLVVAVTAGDLFPHWTVDDLCTQATGCMVTTVQLLLNCLPPSANYSLLEDCVSSTYTITVNVVNTGDGATVSLNYNVNGGSFAIQPGLGAGTYVIGPFSFGDVVDVVVAHEFDPVCNVSWLNVTNPGDCPIISCGPDTYSYCYFNGDQTVFVYQSASALPIGLLFFSGQMDTYGDNITIYNGINTFAPVLYSGIGNFGDLSGLQFISSNPNNALTIALNMNTFYSCADGFFTSPWSYLVGCYDGCVAPTTTFAVDLDCANNVFYVESEITNLGTATAITITNNGGAPDVIATATGTYISGPFAYGSVVTMALNTGSPLCTTNSDPLTNGICPTIIDCDQPELNVTYCYPNFMNQDWSYESSGGQPLAILFSSGTIESDFYDDLTIYDGPNANSPILWQHIGGTQDLTGVLAVSTGPQLYMRGTSDGSVACQTNPAWEWNWTVGCLDCFPTTTSFEVIPDCIHRTYQVAVQVDSLGTATAVNIYNTLSGDTLFNMPAGQTLIGPFPMDSATKVTVFNNDNSLCRITSPELIWNSDTCIVDTCGSANFSYCWQSADTAWFSYASTQGTDITVRFLSGDLGLSDKVLFYNGATPLSAVIFFGNSGGNMTNFALNSNNVNNTLTFVVMSDATGSCADGTFAPLEWDVQCGAVGIDELAGTGFRMFPNPTSGLLYIELFEAQAKPLSIAVFDVAGRQVLNVPVNNLAFGTNTIDLGTLQNGQYLVQVTSVDQVVAQRVLVAR